jgi:hypothetical protein
MLKLMDENHKLTKVASIGIGIFASLLLAIVGFNVVKNTRAEDAAPRDVVVSDITQNSAKVAWSTGQDTQGVIEYGTSPTALNFFAPEALKSKNHSVDLTLLSPSTTYYFQIRVADQKYDNGGVPWQYVTKSSDTSTTQPGDTVAAPTTVQPSPTIAVAEPTTATVPSSGTSLYSPTCAETDCEKIKASFGKGCSTQDYIKCIKSAQ